MTNSILELINTYGEYLFILIVFIWTALEGETIVIVAGYYAHQGLLNVHFLIVAAWLGSFLGDQIFFTLGRRYGNKILQKRPKWQRGVDRALKLFERYDTLFILSFRFIYGVRNFSSVAMGLSHLSWTRFAILNFIAAGIWATSFAYIGYGLAQLFHGEDEIGSAVKWLTLTMLAVFIIVAIIVVLINRRNKMRELAENSATKNSDKPQQ